ncbi:MAG: hypothetical protein AAF438_21465 [Pseudomonadota bacterium]
MGSTLSTGFADTGDKVRKPPAVAVAACEAQVEGDQCAFVGRHEDDLSGTCRVVKEDVLACVPEYHKPRHSVRQNTLE